MIFRNAFEDLLANRVQREKKEIKDSKGTTGSPGPVELRGKKDKRVKRELRGFKVPNPLGSWYIRQY